MAVDAPLPHIAMPDSLSSSPLSPALNPAFDEQLIQETMPAPEMANEDAAANDDIEKEEEEEPSAFAPQGADPDADTGLQRAFTLLEDSAPEEPPEEKERRVL